MASVSTALPARLRLARPGVLLLAASAPAVLLVARLLPPDGVGLALRLGAATVCIVVLPGALVVRALGSPSSPALALVGSVTLSLAILFAAFAVTFATNGSLVLTVGVLAAVALAALLPAARAAPLPVDRGDRRAIAAVVVAAAVFGGIVWWAAGALGTGDVLFHLARARKLAEADVLESVGVVNEFRDGGLHPGYAFPLWHGVLALVARLAGVDVAVVTLHLASALVPIAFVAAYAAGAELFRSWAGGIAALVAQVGQVGFSRAGTGSFASLALPASITRVVLVPALLALVFAFLRGGPRRALVPVGAAALAVAVVHPTYLVFAAMALGGFALVWLLVTDRPRREAGRLAAAIGAVVVPSGFFFLWLVPVITSTASHSPSEGEKARALAHYGEQLQVVGDAYRAAPGAITRAGPVVIAALLALPFLAFAARRVWAAFALGGSLLLLAVLLVPDVFARFSDLVSISQSRRLAQFLPVPFAVAAAAVLFGRFRLVAVLAALAAGIALQMAYPGEFTHEVDRAGPTWPLWIAVVGGCLALASGVGLRRRRDLFPAEPSGWAAAVALAFVFPVAVAGFADLERARGSDPDALTPGLVEALRDLNETDVVFAPVETSYRVAAFAPVYVAASPPPHVGDTDENRPYRRQRDVTRFFAGERLPAGERMRILTAYGAGWLLVDKRRPHPRQLVSAWRPAYEDHRYALFPVPTT